MPDRDWLELSDHLVAVDAAGVRRPVVRADLLARLRDWPTARRIAEQLPVVDGALDPVEAELVRGHLESCAGCAALAHALSELSEALPAMQEVDPGRAFTAAVIARTSGSRSRRSQLADRFRALWMRPAFALEGAYLGALVLVGVFALPGMSSLKAVPKLAADAVAAKANQVEERAVQDAEKIAARFAVRVREVKRGVERKVDAAVASIKKTEKTSPKETP